MELAIFAILLVIFISVAVARARKNAAAFAERFPPLSDEEFVARCAPGTDPAVALKVRAIVSEALAIDYERIYPSSRLMDDLGAE